MFFLTVDNKHKGYILSHNLSLTKISKALDYSFPYTKVYII